MRNRGQLLSSAHTNKVLGKSMFQGISSQDRLWEVAAGCDMACSSCVLHFYDLRTQKDGEYARFLIVGEKSCPSPSRFAIGITQKEDTCGAQLSFVSCSAF